MLGRGYDGILVNTVSPITGTRAGNEGYPGMSHESTSPCKKLRKAAGSDRPLWTLLLLRGIRKVIHKPSCKGRPKRQTVQLEIRGFGYRVGFSTDPEAIPIHQDRNTPLENLLLCILCLQVGGNLSIRLNKSMSIIHQVDGNHRAPFTCPCKSAWGQEMSTCLCMNYHREGLNDLDAHIYGLGRLHSLLILSNELHFLAMGFYKMEPYRSMHTRDYVTMVKGSRVGPHGILKKYYFSIGCMPSSSGTQSHLQAFDTQSGASFG
ncbi:hypothetical protein VNO77_07880 [Canavalia gladiata]|uniref:Uncharacterized protein n=1 Tax=Canavalia gladiata TaxID=3824 RepID=A0AAN9QWD0_CANGL